MSPVKFTYTFPTSLSDAEELYLVYFDTSHHRYHYQLKLPSNADTDILNYCQLLQIISTVLDNHMVVVLQISLVVKYLSNLICKHIMFLFHILNVKRVFNMNRKYGI